MAIALGSTYVLGAQLYNAANNSNNVADIPVTMVAINTVIHATNITIATK
jgi:hypothetical protein